MAQPTKLVVLAAFDLDDEGNLHPAFEARQVDSAERAVREARMIADKHAGVVAWSRDADPMIGGIRAADHPLSERADTRDGVTALPEAMAFWWYFGTMMKAEPVTYADDRLASEFRNRKWAVVSEFADRWRLPYRRGGAGQGHRRIDSLRRFEEVCLMSIERP